MHFLIYFLVQIRTIHKRARQTNKFKSPRVKQINLNHTSKERGIYLLTRRRTLYAQREKRTKTKKPLLIIASPTQTVDFCFESYFIPLFSSTTYQGIISTEQIVPDPKRKTTTTTNNNNNNKMKVVGSTSCGKLPKVFSGNKEAIQFHIHDFANRNQKRGKCICTDNIRVQGYLWSLVIYPRGHSESKTDAEYVSFYLRCEVENSISNPVVAMTDIRTKTKSTTLGKVYFSKGSYRGWHNFSKRQDIIQNDCTQEGTLTVTVELDIATEKNAVWFPRQSQLYQSAETTSDETFVVGNVGKYFMVHKRILALRARELYELVIGVEELSNNNNNNNEGHGTIIIVLPDIDEKVFKLFLDFFYTGKVPELEKTREDDREIAKLILDAANRFSCTYLKLYIESVIVEEFLVPPNAAVLLLLADSYSCALLKEALYGIDHSAVMESKDDWTKLKESNDLLEELLVYTNNPGGRKIYSSVVENGDGTLEDVDDFDVTSLRERLEKANLNVDGSRQILVERWKHCLRHTDARGQFSLGTGGNTSNRGRTSATGWRRILKARRLMRNRDFDESGYFTWVYQGDKTVSHLMTAALVVGFFCFVCMWPTFLRVFVWYLAVSLLL